MYIYLESKPHLNGQEAVYRIPVPSVGSPQRLMCWICGSAQTLLVTSCSTRCTCRVTFQKPKLFWILEQIWPGKEIGALCFSPQLPQLLRMPALRCLVVGSKAHIFPMLLQRTAQPVGKTQQEQLLGDFPLLRYWCLLSSTQSKKFFVFFVFCFFLDVQLAWCLLTHSEKWRLVLRVVSDNSGIFLLTNTLLSHSELLNGASNGAFLGGSAF